MKKQKKHHYTAWYQLGDCRVRIKLKTELIARDALDTMSRVVGEERAMTHWHSSEWGDKGE